MKIDVKYEQYETKKITDNSISYIDDFEQYLLESINISNDQIYDSEQTKVFLSAKDRKKIHNRIKQDNTLLNLEEIKKNYQKYRSVTAAFIVYRNKINYSNIFKECIR